MPSLFRFLSLIGVLACLTYGGMFMLATWFDRMDLVLREDFDVQRKLLERAQAKLSELEARVRELESPGSKSGG